MAEHQGGGQLSAMVAQAWDLRQIDERYGEFLTEFDRHPADHQAAEDPLTRLVQLVHAWRRFPFVDPALPPELLPERWSGARAAELFRRQRAGWTAEAWGLVDAAVPRRDFAEHVARRARDAAASPRAAAAHGGERSGASPGIELVPLERRETAEEIRYPYVAARLNRAARVVEITVAGPAQGPPAGAARVAEQGTGSWPLALTRALDDLILRLRTDETELGTWVLRAEGDPDLVLAYDAQLAELAGDWLVNEAAHYYSGPSSAWT